MRTEEAVVAGVNVQYPFLGLVWFKCTLAIHVQTFSSIDSAGGSYLPSGPPNGARPGLHPAGYPIPRVPLSPFPGGPPSQPYAIPTRGPVGAVPHAPQPGNHGFGAGRGTLVGGQLPHQQATQLNVGTIGPSLNFPLDSPNSQPSPGGPLSQPGYVNTARIS